jgi:Spy/CpxP family protein refolding chaperone
MTLIRSLILTLVLSVIGAGLGAWGGAQYVLHRPRQPVPLHEMVHEKLHLTADQQHRIAGMEREHEARRQVLEAEMRAAYTPKVQAAIDHFHMAMGSLQKETMIHVLAMRAVLTPRQAAKFDDTVVQSLTQDPK